jgi:hypothetical protein
MVVMKAMKEVKFFAKIAPTTRLDAEKPEIPYSLKIRGVAVDTTVNKNNWRVNEKLLDKVAQSLIGKTLRVNHGDKVSDVVGRIENAMREGNKVIFEGNIIGSDMITTSVKEKIMLGLLDSVSIGMEGFKVICSVCGKETRRGGEIIHDVSLHEPPGYEDIIDGDVKELSVVLDPAYEATKINISASFIAALENMLESGKVISAENAEVTGEVGVEQYVRPTDKNAAKEGDKMSATVPTAEPSGGSAPSMDEFKRVLQDAFKGFESEISKKMAELESRLKALEEAKKMEKEAEEAKKKTEDEMKKNAEEAKDKGEDEEAEEDAEAEVEASLQKSSTLVGKPKKGFYGWDEVIAELDLAMRKQVPTFKG